jgi:acyl-CoA thioesterase FadM
MFTPEQLQPRTGLWLCMNSWAAWMREHAVSFRNLIIEHGTGVVVLGGEMEYLEPFRFADADTMNVDITLRVFKGGQILQPDVTVYNKDGKVAVTARGVCRVVRIADMALGALPGGLPEAVLAKFEPDEVSQASPAKPVAPMVADIETNWTKVISAEHPLFINRHLVEVADQWSFIESSGFAEKGRELTCRAHRKEIPLLNKGLGVAIKSFWIELSRPMYVYDSGTIVTTVYQKDAELAFVHRIISPTAGGKPHALMLERIRQ